MKKLIFYIIIQFLFISCAALYNAGLLYAPKGEHKDGERDGEWTFYHENGQMASIGNYKDGELDGKYTFYYENGQIGREGSYKDGGEVGKWTHYYENGQIKQEGSYKDIVDSGLILQRRVGKWTYYYKNGQIEQEGNYKDYERDGKWTRYYENGQIKQEGNYRIITVHYRGVHGRGLVKKDVERDGKWIFYYENGQIEKEVNYKDGDEIKPAANNNHLTLSNWHKIKLLSSEQSVKNILGEPHGIYYTGDSMIRAGQKKHLVYGNGEIILLQNKTSGNVVRVDAPDGNYIDGIKRKW